MKAVQFKVTPVKTNRPGDKSPGLELDEAGFAGNYLLAKAWPTFGVSVITGRAPASTATFSVAV